MPFSRLVHIPYTLLLLVIGMVIGLIGCRVDLAFLSISLRQWVHLNPPTIFFYVFLAPLIFEASFNTRWHVFKRLLGPILTAAFVIVSLQVGLIAAFQKVVVGYDDWSWWSALMFGAMLSATDPISVTATLKSLGASEFLNTLIEGESLVNDGSAFVMWEAFVENAVEPDALSNGEIVLSIFKLSIGGMLMGVGFGVISLVILGLVYDEFEVETSLTVIVAFLGFWTAQSPSKLSGVICNVASGLTFSAFGRHLITPAVRGPLAEFWELLSWIANTIVFVHAGLLLSAFAWSCAGDPNTYVDYLLVFGYYLYLQVIRMGLILLFQPLMSIGNKWFRWKEAVVVGFSGLRGAVSLVLALEVAGKSEIPSTVQSRVVLWTTGIVALSLLVNGFLVKPLIQLLKLDKAKKSREEFLLRARAVMVQRSLIILDILCVETGFKTARWSYVVKNVLPEEWLHDSEHAEGYRHALEQIMDNRATTTRKSLETVAFEEREKIIHTQVNHRLSMGQQSITVTPLATPRPSVHAHGFPSAPYSPRIPASVLASPPGPLSPAGHHAHSGLWASNEGADTSIGPISRDGGAFHGDALGMDSLSMEGGAGNRRSIDVDVMRYRQGGPQKVSQARIHREVADLHRQAQAGHSFEFTEKDREVQRRLLTAILSHVRAISNASLVEFSVMHSLEEDCQLALDANDEGRDYDLFSFLDNRGRQTGNNPVFKTYLRLIEGERLKGQTSITTAILVYGILAQILKEEILHSSPIVQLQAEQLYEGAAALLNRFETLNPFAFEWVESQFAIYVTAKKQDEVLDDMLSSGVVDHQEYHVIHHELIDVRRKHIRSRQSLFHRARNGFPAHPKPRAMLREHPLFANLNPDLLSSVVNRYGELVHLQSGQTVQTEKGALVLVLDGAIRPVDDEVLPAPMAARLRKVRSKVGLAMMDRRNMNIQSSNPARSSSSGSVGEDGAQDDGGFAHLGSGATMHWCFPAHNGFCGPSVILNAHNRSTGERCAIAPERAHDTQFCCCEIAGKATVFTLPVAQVRQLAKESEAFKLEITRSLAREIVLESVADQRPYTLAHFMDSVSALDDVHTVVGRAFRVLERLPYMRVLALEGAEMSAVHIQGPGVLLNGKVRVSIVDTSGLVGAVNLLHEELVGPALLPAGGLILQEVQKSDDEPLASSGTLTSGGAIDATELYEVAEQRMSSTGEPRVFAHVLIEEVSEHDLTAIHRLNRWTRRDLQIDMNGRFGMYRHVDLHAFQEPKVE